MIFLPRRLMNCFCFVYIIFLFIIIIIIIIGVTLILLGVVMKTRFVHKFNFTHTTKILISTKAMLAFTLFEKYVQHLHCHVIHVVFLQCQWHENHFISLDLLECQW